jgi:hypothetical protein
LGAIAHETMRHALEPIAAPDRILDARATVYEGAPSPCRLYASRRHGAGWAALRPATTRDYELVAPYTDGDLLAWVQMQVELSACNTIPTPWEELDGTELVFLLALIDAFKSSLHGSFTSRRTAPKPLTFLFSDIVEAQNEALRTRDRRWLLSALGEIFDVLLHPGGQQAIGLPMLSPELAEREVRRYVERGWLRVVDRGTNPLLALDGALPLIATSLLSWIEIVSLHDIQVIGWDGARAIATEEVAILVVAEAAVWAVVSRGLSTATDDLTSVAFGVRPLNLLSVVEFARRFTAALPVEGLPDEIYGAQSAPAAAGAGADRAPVADTTPAPAPAPVAEPAKPAPWRATHRVRAEGADAYSGPGPAGASTRLDPWLEVEVVRRRANGYVRIVCSNGWAAWVDGSTLEEVSG